MIGSGVLDVVIGVVSLYVLLSLICSVITEGIARMFAMRSSNLKTGIRNLINDPRGSGYADLLYEHPLISGLYRQGRFDKLLRRDGKPSYISPRNFSMALFDIIAGTRKSFDEVRSMVAAIPYPQVRYALLPLLDEAGGDLETARKSVEGWFNDAMERVSGWYKRKVQIIILAVAVAVSVSLNADTFYFAHTLWNDTALRQTVVTAAEQSTGQHQPAGVQDAREQLETLQPLLGWNSRPDTMSGWLAKAFGLAFTAIALSLGAPFWFDVLNKLINIRNAGDSPGTSSAAQSGEQASG